MDKHHILVVDDNHINRLFFESSLKKLNYLVSLAENGYQAIQLCQQQRFDLIFMDIRMDGLDGIQTATNIKQSKAHLNTPVLAISAEHFNAKQYPVFVASLLKPVSQLELKRVLAHHLPSSDYGVACFDEQQALQISHQDPDIVLKLRGMLIEQLPADWQMIKQLFEQQDWSALDAYLHKIYGSAKICAASLLMQHIQALKKSVQQQENNTAALQGLKFAINETMAVNKQQLKE